MSDPPSKESLRVASLRIVKKTRKSFLRLGSVSLRYATSQTLLDDIHLCVLVMRLCVLVMCVCALVMHLYVLKMLSQELTRPSVANSSPAV